ncbi:MAG: PRC-barrel domain [Candidatus Parcubacteria bacterium]|jgi:sporulation protein YlmC with PRC-barrel domain
MVLSAKQLIHLPVRTSSGIGVGKVSGVEIDTDTGRLASVLVKTGGLLAGLIGKELVVAWNQVVSISETEVVVEDATVPAHAVRSAMQPSAATASGAHLSTTDAV